MLTLIEYVVELLLNKKPAQDPKDRMVARAGNKIIFSLLYLSILFVLTFFIYNTFEKPLWLKVLWGILVVEIGIGFLYKKFYSKPENHSLMNKINLKNKNCIVTELDSKDTDIPNILKTFEEAKEKEENNVITSSLHEETE